MGSIPFRSTSDAEMVLELAPGDVVFWTRFAAGRGRLLATYDVELCQQGVAVGSTTCDPLRPAHLCTHRSIGFEDYDYACRMNCGVRLERGGETVVRARFRAWAGPPGSQLREADSIIRQ